MTKRGLCSIIYNRYYDNKTLLDKCTEIKKILIEIVENEDKKRPLSDDALCEVLCKKGYKIARRTVAKYREQADIPVARLRKEL